MVREVGLEPTRPKTQVPKTCVSAVSPLPLMRTPPDNEVTAREQG